MLLSAVLIQRKERPGRSEFPDDQTAWRKMNLNNVHKHLPGEY